MQFYILDFWVHFEFLFQNNTGVVFKINDLIAKVTVVAAAQFQIDERIELSHDITVYFTDLVVVKY